MRAARRHGRWPRAARADLAGPRPGRRGRPPFTGWCVPGWCFVRCFVDQRLTGGCLIAPSLIACRLVPLGVVSIRLVAGFRRPGSSPAPGRLARRRQAGSALAAGSRSLRRPRLLVVARACVPPGVPPGRSLRPISLRGLLRPGGGTLARRVRPTAVLSGPVPGLTIVVVVPRAVAGVVVAFGPPRVLVLLAGAGVAGPVHIGQIDVPPGVVINGTGVPVLPGAPARDRWPDIPA
jgi:hypothetical protein